ncbi:MAG: hypothetical protein JO314_12520 [Acidobacteria bacterium]|nr:hypothetical protein [Acidobacteriota bacterium]
MIRSRNQNSILAVATLGVYLGLILAGATPSVLAQAATAKQFSVKDEVAKRDDLDNKPEGCDLLAAKVKEKRSQFVFDENDLLGYATGLQQTLQSYLKLHGSFSDLNWDLATAQLSTVEATEKPVLIDAKYRPHRQDKDSPVIGLSGSLPGTAFEFYTISNGYDVITTATTSRQNDREAQQLAIAYDAVLDLYRCSPRNPAEELILDYTEIAWADNQVFIITRLPRGSLDALLASNAK